MRQRCTPYYLGVDSMHAGGHQAGGVHHGNARGYSLVGLCWDMGWVHQSAKLQTCNPTHHTPDPQVHRVRHGVQLHPAHVPAQQAGQGVC